MSTVKTKDLLVYIIGIIPDEKYSEKTNNFLNNIYKNIMQIQHAHNKLVWAYNQDLKVDTPQQRNEFLDSLKLMEQACQSMHATARKKIRV